MERSKFGLEWAGEWNQLLPLFPKLFDSTMLDLGCGYGWHCSFAAKNGAKKIIGIDQSENMLEVARKQHNADNIEYIRCNLLKYDYPDNTYDFVLANLVLHYIDNLETLYKSVYRTLKNDGIFLFNIEHPTYTSNTSQEWADDGTWPVDNYFYPGLRTTNFLGCKVEKYHHTLTQILNDLIKVGFYIENIEEVVPPEKWQAILPNEMRRPMMLLVKAKKRI